MLIPLTTSSNIDWFKLLTELQAIGIKNAEIARMMNVPRWKVHDWKMGVEPQYSYGVQIVQIYHANVALKHPHSTTSAL